MKFLMQEKIIPYLRHRFELGIIKARVLHMAGIGESLLDEIIGTDLLEGHNPTIGLAAHSGQVDVRITAKADTEADADAMIAPIEQVLREKTGRWLYGVDGETLKDVFTALLQTHHLKIALVDAGLGGALERTLRKSDASVLASAEVFNYPAEAAQMLQINASNLRELSEAAVIAVQNRTGVTIAIAIISNPDINESADSSESTVVSIRVGEQQRTRVYGFGGKSDLVQEWLETWCLAQTWSMVKDIYTL